MTKPKTEKPKHAGGRPSKITRELIGIIAGHVAKGSPIEVAARAAGVDKKTFFAWMTRGHKGEGIYAEFLHRMEEAAAEADIRDHANIVKHSLKDWKASARHLELRHPNRYRPAQRHEHSGPGGAPIQTQSTSEAALMSLFAKLAGVSEQPEAEVTEGATDDGEETP